MSSCAVPVIRPAGQVTDANATVPVNSVEPAPVAAMPMTMTHVVYGVLAGLAGGTFLGWLFFAPSATSGPRPPREPSVRPPDDLIERAAARAFTSRY